MKTYDVECQRLNRFVMEEAMAQLKNRGSGSSKSRTYRTAQAELASKSPGLKATIEENQEKPGERVIHCDYYQKCSHKEEGCIYDC